jgi:hypothetical protein
MNDLATFRPLSAEMQNRVRSAAEETRRLLAKEEAYLPENRNESYIAYLKSHLRMLENELKIATA